MARPTKLNAALQRALCGFRREGLSLRNCAYLGRITPSTLCLWLNNSDEFSEHFRLAEAECNRELNNALRGDPKTLVKLVDRIEKTLEADYLSEGVVEGVQIEFDFGGS